MSYIILRGRWCDIIVQNVHAPTEDKIGDIKDRFYEQLEHVFDKFPKYLGKTFSNQQFGMRVYINIVMIMELE
jgi:hypothetical protein